VIKALGEMKSDQVDKMFATTGGIDIKTSIMLAKYVLGAFEKLDAKDSSKVYFFNQ
jgi:hypothetical protein